MFSNDHNVELIARLITNLKRYGELRIKGAQLGLVSKLTLLLTFAVVCLILVGVMSIVVLLLSFALVHVLAPYVGGMPVACCVVAAGFLILGLCFIIFRKSLLINPLVRILAAIFIGDNDEFSVEDADREEAESSNAKY